MEFKYVVSNYDVFSETTIPVAVFDDEEAAREYAVITFGDTTIDGFNLVDKVVSFLEGGEQQDVQEHSD